MKGLLQVRLVRADLHLVESVVERADTVFMLRRFVYLTLSSALFDRKFDRIRKEPCYDARSLDGDSVLQSLYSKTLSFLNAF